MQCCSLVSGSSGNAFYIQTPNTRILVDAGVSCRRLLDAMRLHQIRPADIDALLITHSHSDHVLGAGVFSRKFHIPIYATAGTWQGMSHKIGKIAAEHQRLIRPYEPLALGEVVVLPIATHHDARESVGFRCFYKGHSIVVLTDTGMVDPRMLEHLHGAQFYYFEANHDLEMLAHSRYPEDTRARIRSSKGHLSNHQSGEILQALLNETRAGVLLAHLSNENNDPSLCLQTVQRYIQEATHYAPSLVRVAPRNHPSAMYCTEQACFLELEPSSVMEESQNRSGQIFPAYAPSGGRT